jgi:hypothetical protein
LRLFDDAGTEAPQLGIPRGSFYGRFLEVLRDAGEPLSTCGIAEALAGEKGLNKRQMGLLVARVSNAPPRLRDNPEGELRVRSTYWRVKSGG